MKRTLRNEQEYFSPHISALNGLFLDVLNYRNFNEYPQKVVLLTIFQTHWDIFPSIVKTYFPVLSSFEFFLLVPNLVCSKKPNLLLLRVSCSSVDRGFCSFHVLTRNILSNRDIFFLLQTAVRWINSGMIRTFILHITSTFVIVNSPNPFYE